MRDCAKGVFDGWSLTPEFYALPVDGILIHEKKKKPRSYQSNARILLVDME